MTTPQSLWSDERIEDEMCKFVHDPAYIDGATIVTRAMRDDYEADRAAHLARIAKLEAELAEATANYQRLAIAMDESPWVWDEVESALTREGKAAP